MFKSLQDLLLIDGDILPAMKEIEIVANFFLFSDPKCCSPSTQVTVWKFGAC